MPFKLPLTGFTLRSNLGYQRVGKVRNGRSVKMQSWLPGREVRRHETVSWWYLKISVIFGDIKATIFTTTKKTIR